MVEPIQGLPSNLLNALTSTFGTSAVQSFVSYVEQGVPVSQAYSMAFGNDVRNDGRADAQALAQAFDDMPDDVRQRIVQGADTLPPPVREALEQLGITQPQQHRDGPGNSMTSQSSRTAAEGAPAAPTRDGFANAGQVAQALNPGSTGRPATGAAGNPFAAQEAVQRAPGSANQQIAAAPHGDRALGDFAALPINARNEGVIAGRALEPGQAVLMADRMQAAQQQAQPHALPLSHGRADALPAQLAPMLAGATMLANPIPGQATAPAPPGTDAAAAQAREAQLVPGGHTIGGFLRRDLRRGSVQVPGKRTPDSLLLALLPGRRRREDDEQDPSSFQWLFWILTVIAYAAVAVAVVSMIPSGGGLTDGYGRPTYGAYALVIGAVAAVASWLLGRRLSRR